MIIPSLQCIMFKCTLENIAYRYFLYALQCLLDALLPLIKILNDFIIL